MGNLADLYHLSRFANRHPLARENKRRTFLRFMRWQVASRAIQQPIVLPFVGDSRLIISKQMPGAAVNYYFGLPEVEEVSLALHFLRERRPVRGRRRQHRRTFDCGKQRRESTRDRHGTGAVDIQSSARQCGDQ